MGRPKKPWSLIVEEVGVRVRVYERSPGSLLYREVRDSAGDKDRKSLGHRDRVLAEAQARALARRLFELRDAGLTSTLTLGQLVALYELHRLPRLSANRQAIVRRTYRPYVLAHFGAAFAVENFSQTIVDDYVAARRARTIKSDRHRGVATTPRDGTIRAELNWLKSVIRWGKGYKVNGRPVVPGDPLVGITFLREKNPRRPVASEERFTRTLAVANDVDRHGRLACMLSLARFTGRRVSAIRQLRARDVYLTREHVLRALAAAGLDERQVDYMPHGAIRWPAETDKQGFEELTAISSGARAALERYVRANPRVGASPLFPNIENVDQPISRIAADHLLRSAEKRAGLAKLERGLWHPYRRLFASERKHLPDVDTAKAGGWRDLATMRNSYQQSDPATLLKVVENRPERPAIGDDVAEQS